MEFGGDDKKRKLEEPNGSNGEAVSLSGEEIRQLLNPLTKEQLQELLLDAALQYAGVANDVREAASKDPAHRKLFVRGLAWETTSQKLRDAFQEYGEIEEGAVVIDKATGKSRGFGFITFKTMDGAYRALKEPSKKIDGRITVCNLAAVGSQQGGATAVASKDLDQRKLYVGGLDYNTTTETLLNYFGQWGDIEEGSVAYDKHSGKSRGFGFITYKNVASAKQCLGAQQKTIDGRNLNVKLAVEGAKQQQGHGSSSAPPQYNQGPSFQQQPQQHQPQYSQISQLGNYGGLGAQTYQSGLGATGYGLVGQPLQQQPGGLYGSQYTGYSSQLGQGVGVGASGLGGLQLGGLAGLGSSLGGGLPGLSSGTSGTTSSGLPGQLGSLAGLGGYYTGGM